VFSIAGVEREEDKDYSFSRFVLSYIHHRSDCMWEHHR
jgi:hypothetical protein